VAARTYLLDLAGVKIRLRVDGDPGLLDLARPLHTTPTSGRASVDLDLRWIEGRGVLRDGSRVALRSNSRAELVLWAEWLATTMAIARLRPQTPLLHAAWLARGRRGVLVAGAHGLGKSSLGAALRSRKGWSLFGDDITLALPGGILRPLERPLRLKPGSRRLLPEIETPGWPAGSIALHPVDPGSAALRAIVLLGPRGKGRLRMDPVSPGVAVAALSKLTLNFKEAAGTALTALAALTKKAPAWRMSAGSIEERCASMEGLLR
jgi:hypothetical protein